MRILWIPHTGWHIPQRAQFFCRALSERHEIHVTDWVADFTKPRDYFSHRYLENFLYRRYQDGRITVHGIPRVSPAIYSKLLRRINTVIFQRFVDWIIKSQRIDVVVGTFLVPPPKASRLVFDLFDENVLTWRSSYQTREYGDEIDGIERAYLHTADAVVVSSSVLADKAKEIGTRGPVYRIPNGIDLNQFNRSENGKAPSSLNHTGCLVGSVGNYDTPEELELLLDAAEELSESNINFLIAGRGSAIPEAQKRVQANNITNVNFKGYIPPGRLAETISSLDAGLCPYIKTPMDDARSPMRLLAYSAAGLPVVCTDLEEVRRMGFPNVVLVKDNGKSLAAGIEAALKMPKKQPFEIHAYDIHQLARKYEEVLTSL
jgi:glycosyltransferase involved in cell wall biosynthesis